MKVALLIALVLVVSFQAEASVAFGVVDNMRNTSNLSDEEIEWYLENSTRSELAEALDKNNDGYADGTNKRVAEFIARIRVIIICKRERLEAYEKWQQMWRLYRYFSDRSAPSNA